MAKEVKNGLRYSLKSIKGGPQGLDTSARRIYYSRPVKGMRQAICELGFKLWDKGFVEGNAGNISLRLADNLVLATPTLRSKGFLKAEEIALVTLEGRQLAGQLPVTSEIVMHLAVFAKTQAIVCIHAHPVHVLAFALSGQSPPSGILPEVEIFLGEIGLAPYRTPGSQDLAETIGELAPRHQCIIMANHGVVVWGKGLEDAYWKIEVIDAYCHALLHQAQLGEPLKRLSPAAMQKLFAIRRRLGMPEERDSRDESDLYIGKDFGGKSIELLP